MLGLCAALAVAFGLPGCGGNGPTAPPPIVQPPVVQQPPPPPPPSTPVLGKLRYLAFGDSLTYGVVHLTAARSALTPGLAQSYPFKLQAMLSARYTNQVPVVMNAGLPGERASEARSRLKEVLKEGSPDVVLLLDGANDLLALGEDGLGITNEAMKDLVRTIKGSGAIVLLATQPRQRVGGTKASAAPIIEDFNRDLKRMADVEGVQVVDLYSRFEDTLQGPDGLHPSDAGYTRIAEIFFDAIKAAFEVPAATGILAR
jgi:lysophospholipase L1-like esterase